MKLQQSQYMDALPHVSLNLDSIVLIQLSVAQLYVVMAFKLEQRFVMMVTLSVEMDVIQHAQHLNLAGLVFMLLILERLAFHYVIKELDLTIKLDGLNVKMETM